MMTGKIKKRLKRILAFALLFYVIAGLALYFLQDRFLFHPQPVQASYLYNFGVPYQEMNLPFGRENLSIVTFQAQVPRKGLVLFYHGNRRNVEHYAKYPSVFLRNGYDIWMIDYPGFGKTTGKRTEAIIYEQALLMYDLASRKIHSDSIVIYGKSIGTGIASYVASNKNCKRLILETPYYSIDALAKHYFPFYPVTPMTRYGFPAFKYLKQVKASISFFHGTEDEIIPYRQAEKLKKEKPSIELITIEGGKHNNLSSFQLFQWKIDSLLSK
jgi:uncharacterized protein